MTLICLAYRHECRLPPRDALAPYTFVQITATKYKNIDFGDIPELDEAVFQEIEFVEPCLAEQVTIYTAVGSGLFQGDQLEE